MAEPALKARWLRRRLVEFAAAVPGVDVSLVLRSDVNNPEHVGTDLILNFQERLAGTNCQVDRLVPLDAFPACAPRPLVALAVYEQKISGFC